MTAIPSSKFSPRPAGNRVRAVGAFVPGLTRKSFEKYGFSTATLLTDWTVIVGAELAQFTLPERLKWPRNVDAYEDVDAVSYTHLRAHETILQISYAVFCLK